MLAIPHKLYVSSCTSASRHDLGVISLIEMIGSFVSGSQALKADALDFLGDDLITFFGLLAIGWSLLWRAALSGPLPPRAWVARSR